MNSSIRPAFFVSLIAAALVALGAAPALAADPEQDQQAPPADQQQQQQQAPDQQAQPEDGGGTPGGTGTEEGGDEEEVAPLSGDKPTQEEVDRFNRFCTSTTSEPSHNDKKFCDDFKAKFGEKGATTSSKGQPTQEEIDRFNRFCKMTNGEPSHNDKKFCEDFKKKYPDYGKGTTAGTNTTPTDTNNEEAKKEDEPDSGPLAFTGLDLWQLALIGVVLVAGGLGARHLLRQREAGA